MSLVLDESDTEGNENVISNRSSPANNGLSLNTTGTNGDQADVQFETTIRPLAGDTSKDDEESPSEIELIEMISSPDTDDAVLPPTQVKYTRDLWADTAVEKVTRIPSHINGTVVYNVISDRRTKLLTSCRDGRKWKNDSHTEWSGYCSVRYRDCLGSQICKNQQYFV